MQRAVNPVGEILSFNDKYRSQYEALYRNNSIQMDAHTVRERAKHYLMELISKRQFGGYNGNNPNYYGMRNSTRNYATEIIRLDSLSFRGLGANNEESYFSFPNWANTKRWGKIQETFGITSTPLDQIEIPSILFSGDCSENHVALVSSIYENFPDPGRKNPATIPINKMRLDSKIMEADVLSIPTAANSKNTNCKPDIKLLLRRPLKLTFELKSGRNRSRSLIKDGSRKLQFHIDDASESLENEIRAKYCAVWNTEIGPNGAWDTADMKMMYSDDTVVECISTKFGTFGIVVEIYEPPHVADDKSWLLITKMVGYSLSMLCLLIFACAVLVSKHLWEMFHIVGMNFSAALVVAMVFMILSELSLVRDNHNGCTLIGFGIQFFYLSASGLLLFLTFAMFLATTSGIIGGYTGIYLSFGWGTAFCLFGFNVWTKLDLMGDDPRCMIGWEDESKMVFWMFNMLASIGSLILMLIVLCNVHTSALRKQIFVEELSSLAQGLTFLALLYALTWSWYPLSYFKLDEWELPDFYPAFQVMNSWMGVFAFIGIGVASQRFRQSIKAIFRKKSTV